MRLIDADALKANLRVSQGVLDDYGIVHVPYRDVIACIDAAPTVGGWVSVKDKLPEVGVTCLVAFADEGMTFSSLDKSGKWYVVNGLPQPDYWMPLPEPPGGKRVHT